MKIKELLEYGRNNLIGNDGPYRLSKILLKHLLKIEDSYLIIHQDMEVEKYIEEDFYQKINLLNIGKPIQYITNNQEFMGLDFYINENVLIPQPDTETLVQEILNNYSVRSTPLSDQLKDPYKDNIRILDLCTGSGAIGVSIAKYLENAKVIMSDISTGALEVAEKNAINNQVVDKCDFVLSNLFEKIEEKFNVIVSNPPYIKTQVIETLSREVQNEPLLALDGGKDGLKFYKIIVNEAWKYLQQEGILALEIGYDQKEDVIKLLKENGKYKDIYSKKDLAGNDRIVVCRRK